MRTIGTFPDRGRTPLMNTSERPKMRFSFSQKVLFKHCDPAGIVFYPRYFEIINDCVEAFFDTIGTPFETLLKTAGIPTAEISAAFMAPSRHGDQLVISLDVMRIGGSSLELAFQAFCLDDQRFSAKSTLVYVNAIGLPQRWPDPIRSALTPYLRSEE
jgi:4-hydroxybenzoyl-CoA thioesterase